jgi:low affinity Fe/Cu permease
MMNRCSWFNRFAKSSARATGKPMAFILAAGTIVVWAVTGPLFHYSDTWQLVINTSTTIVTFLMVFLIQNTQNRDSDAIQIKLDELIRATRGAHTALLDLEELDDEDMERIRDLYEEIAAKSRQAMEAGEGDTGTPFVHIENTNGSPDVAHLKDTKRAPRAHHAKKRAHR